MATIPALLTAAHDHWDDAAKLSRIGWELHERNRLPEAAWALERTLELNPQDVEAWSQLGYVHLRGWDAKKGLDVLRKGVETTNSNRIRCSLASFESDQDARTALLAAVATDDDPQVVVGAAMARLWTGDDGAYDVIDQGFRDHPDDVYIRENWCWAHLGLRARGMKEGLDLRERAIPVCDRAMELQPDRIFPHWMKTQMLLHEQAWDALLLATEAGLAHSPDDETLMQLRGTAYSKLGDAEAAIHWFSRAIGAKPSYAGAREKLAEVYEEQGRAPLAEAVLREIPDANPDFPGGPLPLVQFLVRQDRLDDAESELVAAWERLPNGYRKHAQSMDVLKPLFDRDAVKALLAE